MCRPAVTANDAAGAEVAGAVGGYSVSVYVNTVSTAKIDETTFLLASGSRQRAALTSDAEARMQHSRGAPGPISSPFAPRKRALGSL